MSDAEFLEAAQTAWNSVVDQVLKQPGLEDPAPLTVV